MKKFLSILRPLIKQFNVPDLYSRTAEVAFYLTISIFPSLIFIICALAYLPDINVLSMQVGLYQVVPDEALLIIDALVDSAIKNRSLHLLFLSFALATWTFSKAVKAMIKGQNMAFGFEEERSFVKLNLTCITYAIGFFFITISCIVFLVYGKKINLILKNLIGDFYILNIFFNILRFLIPFATIIYIFMNFFTTGAARRIHFKQSIPGAVTTTILWLILSVIYSFYTDVSLGSRAIYGSISAIIVLMTWTYFCGMAITIGYKINAIIYHQDLLEKRKRKRVK